MSRNRFLQLSRYLHDNTKAPAKCDPNFTKFFKLGGLEENISKTILIMPDKGHYQPGKEISIDKQMIGMKSRVSFIQYMSKKPKKFCIKIWASSDADTS